MGILGPSIAQFILDASENRQISTPSTTTVYSHSFKLVGAQNLGLAYQAISDGVVSLKIELEQSNVLPATEGAADDNYKVGDSISAINLALSDENQHYYPLNPIATKYGRLKITGLTLNDASTYLLASLTKMELF